MKALNYHFVVIVLFFTAIFSIEAQVIPISSDGVRLDWHPNGTMIAITDGHNTVHVIDVQTNTNINTLPIMPFPIRTLKWSDDGARLALGGQNNIQIWDNAWDNQQAILSLTLQTEEFTFPSGISAIDWNEATQEILAVSWRVYIWNNQTGQMIRTIEPFTTPIINAAWNHNGTQLAYGNITGYITIESQISDQVGGSDTYDRDAPWGLAWNPEGTLLVVGTNSGLIHLFGPDQSRLGSRIIAETASRIFSLDWHPNQPFVASGNVDGVIKIWNINSRTLIRQIQVGTPVMSVVWSPDGSRLAFSGASGELQIADGPIVPIANAGPDQTFIADTSGNALVTLDGTLSSDSDGTIISYEWTENGAEIATGVTPQVSLPVGVHTITLTVTDDDGATASDEVVVTVNQSPIAVAQYIYA